MGRGHLIHTGERYGKLTALALSHVGKKQLRYWRFNCDCGKEAVLQASRVSRGITKSCGCGKRMAGATNPMFKHGNAKRPEHRVWRGMIARCTKPDRRDWPRYGGRGIKVCERWLASFDAFFADVGERPSPLHEIDRIDNDGHYEPGNCQWATRAQQVRNTEKALRVTVDGNEIPLAEACERAGVKYMTAFSRIKAGWPAERILEPAKQHPS